MSNDTIPSQTTSIPADLQAALTLNEAAEAAFTRLPLSHRREYVEWIESAKKSETRQRRIVATVERLAAGKK